MAARGLRVLGGASRLHGGTLPDDPATVPYRFEGLVGFLDPVRPDVAGALADARSAGVHVAMITGDYPATALEIARQSGIDVVGGMLTGGDIEGLGQAELRDRGRTVRVFARVRREQKLVLVEALKANGEVVAMTGDALRAGQPDAEARAMAFVALVIANLILAFADSAEVETSFFDRRRMAFWAIGFVTTSILALILYVPTLSGIFNVERPDLLAMLTALAVALVAGGWFGFLRRTGIVGRRQ